MTGELTAVYGALLALIFVALSFRALMLRRKLGVGVGDGGHRSLTKAIRAHSNFAEYTPMCLFLILLLEVTTGAVLMVHIYGFLLIIGRCVHAYGVSRVEENYKFRVAGMACTFFVLIGCSLRLLLEILLA